MSTLKFYWMRTVGLLIALAFFAPIVLSQTFTGSVVGRVTDTNGAGVPGAGIRITEVGTNRTQSAVANEEGEYVLPQLAPGNYTLRVEMANFKVVNKTGIVLETAQTLRLDVSLEAG